MVATEAMAVTKAMAGSNRSKGSGNNGSTIGDRDSNCGEGNNSGDRIKAPTVVTAAMAAAMVEGGMAMAAMALVRMAMEARATAR